MYSSATGYAGTGPPSGLFTGTTTSGAFVEINRSYVSKHIHDHDSIRGVLYNIYGRVEWGHLNGTAVLFSSSAERVMMLMVCEAHNAAVYWFLLLIRIIMWGLHILHIGLDLDFYNNNKKEDRKCVVIKKKQIRHHFLFIFGGVVSDRVYATRRRWGHQLAGRS